MVQLQNISLNNSTTQVIWIGATDEFPYVLPCFIEYPDRCSRMGLDLEYIYSLLNGILHFNIIWSNYDAFPELQAALEAHEIDLIGNTLVLDWQTVSNITYHFTPPAYYLGIGFFAKSLPVVATLNPFARFTWDLWMCLVSFTLSIWLMKSRVVKKFTITSTSLNITFLVWCFTLVLIGELYGNLLTADLITLNRLQSTYDDLSDLGDKLISGECRFIVFDKYINVSDFQIIFNPAIDTMWAHKFKAAFLINPPFTFQDKSDMYTFIRNSSCVIGLDFVTYDLSSFDNLCNIEVKIYPVDIPFMPYAYYHVLDIQTSTTVDNIFSSESFRSYPDHLARSYNDIPPTVCEELDDKYLLTITKIYVCFAIYAAGIVFAVIAHALSILSEKKKRGKVFADHTVESALELAHLHSQ